MKSMPTQLALFPGKTKKAPPVLEFPKACVIADACRKFLVAGWKWTHLPFGEHRSKATANRLKRMGVMPGWPDYLFVSPSGKHHYVELKRVGGKLNDNQAEMKVFFLAAGVPYLLSNNVREVLVTLQSWGVLRADVRF